MINGRNLVEILRARGRGVLQGNDRFTGRVWINDLKAVPLRILHVTSSPLSRSFWHAHPSGQVLLVLSGRGRMGYKDGEGAGRVLEISRGDIALVSPGEIHWHGAAPNEEMVHVAIHFNSDFSRKRRVTNKEYDLISRREKKGARNR